MTDTGHFNNCLTLPAWCPACGEPSLQASSEKSLRCDHCHFHYFHNVAATSSAIIECEGSILMVRRASDPAAGKLDLPGGFIEPGETAEQALTRELEEELGFVTENEYVYLCNFTNLYQYDGIHYHTLDLYYLISETRRPPIRFADDVSGFEWLGADEIDESKICFDSVRNACAFYRNTRSS